jgi:pimeloyl-ACP methyl ester carboxylesterase
VRYARNRDVRLAYRVFGASGPYVIFVPGWMLNNVDTIDEPGSPHAENVDLISSSIRLIVWDRRRTGLSDPWPQSLSIDQRIDDSVRSGVAGLSQQPVPIANRLPIGRFA